ncbi:MAG: K+/H+ antiporter [Bacteroidales bacterium]
MINQTLLPVLHSAEGILLIVSVILFFSIFAGKAGYRFGLPSLLIFLGVGMLFGSDGLGIQFNSSDTAQFIGMLALTIILFSGGMDTKFAEVRTFLVPGLTLATLGVLITALITGLFAYYLFYWISGNEALSLAEALLLGAVMSSTDSASVFSILHGRKVSLKNNLHLLLELESGSNDPMAYMLTLMLIAFIQAGDMSVGQAAMVLGVQLVLGLVAGYFLGKLLVYIINKIGLNNESFYPILLLAGAIFIFTATTLCNGNGYLAVYVAGLVVGNASMVHKKRMSAFFDGITWLFQIVMFLTLGLLVNPHELLPVAAIGLSIGVFMIMFARPASVALCLFPFKRFTARGMFYVSWVGLRGAVPIIFAIYPLTARIEHANLIFNVVFFITILSLTLQGTTVVSFANWLRLTEKPVRKDVFQIELPDEIKSAMSEIDITPAVLKHGNKLMDFTLPDHTLAVMVRRDNHYFIPKGNTILKEKDKLLMISDNDDALLQAYHALGITDYTMKKN